MTVNIFVQLLTAISNHIRYILATSSLAGRGLGVGFLFRVWWQFAVCKWKSW